MTTALETTGTAIKPELTGIGGWLVLMALGQVFGPLRALGETINTAYTAADYATNAQVPGAVSVMRFEETMAWAYVALAFFVSFLFFTKRRIFPRAFIVLALFSFVYFAIDMVVTSTVFGLPVNKLVGLYFEDQNNVRSMTQSIMLLPWVAYVLMSRRVKNTFIR